MPAWRTARACELSQLARQMHAIRVPRAPLPAEANEMASQPSRMKGFEQVAEACFDSPNPGTPEAGVLGSAMFVVWVNGIALRARCQRQTGSCKALAMNACMHGWQGQASRLICIPGG